MKGYKCVKKRQKGREREREMSMYVWRGIRTEGEQQQESKVCASMREI